jgi:predicted Rossmann fold nucleotide-binding protein DprA/Smf involved in DNA uptake
MRRALSDEPFDIDQLAALSGLNSSRTASALMELSLAGYAVEWPGKRFSRT